MVGILRFLQICSLGTWVGSILFFSFVVAQGAFSVLPNADLAGAVVGYTLARLHVIGVVAGVIFLVAEVGAASLGPAGIKPHAVLLQPPSLLVMLMILCTVISQHGVIARMDVLRSQMGSVVSTSPTDPLRIAFDRLHKYSVRLEVVVLLSGLTALFFTARQKP